jgi:hypothetical protein
LWMVNCNKNRRLDPGQSRVLGKIKCRLQRIYFAVWLDTVNTVFIMNRISKISCKNDLRIKSQLVLSILSKWEAWYMSRKRHRWVSAIMFWRLKTRCLFAVLDNWQKAVKNELLLVKVGKWVVGRIQRVRVTSSLNLWGVNARGTSRLRQDGDIRSNQCNRTAFILNKQSRRFTFSIIFRAWAAVARRITVLKRAEHLYSMLIRLRLYKRAWVLLAIHCANEGRVRVELLANRLYGKWTQRRALSWAWDSWLAGNLEGSESSYQSTRKSPATTFKVMAC